MAQTRETAANTAAQSLFTKNDPTDIKNEPELSAISKKFIYHDINKQIKLSTAKQELLTLIVLTANNTPEDIPAHVEGALRAGATPEQVHESIFHCTTRLWKCSKSSPALLPEQLPIKHATKQASPYSAPSSAQRTLIR